MNMSWWSAAHAQTAENPSSVVCVEPSAGKGPHLHHASACVCICPIVALIASSLLRGANAINPLKRLRPPLGNAGLSLRFSPDTLGSPLCNKAYNDRLLIASCFPLPSSWLTLCKEKVSEEAKLYLLVANRVAFSNRSRDYDPESLTQTEYIPGEAEATPSPMRLRSHATVALLPNCPNAGAIIGALIGMIVCLAMPLLQRSDVITIGCLDIECEIHGRP